jgi:transketolase
VLDPKRYDIYEGVRKGAYILERSGRDLILAATGSERDSLVATGNPGALRA